MKRKAHEPSLCVNCKATCKSRGLYQKGNFHIAACKFYTEEPYPPFHTKCNKCGEPALTCTVVGMEMLEHDTCLGPLPGVKSACCGHGNNSGHIIFTNGTRVSFKPEGFEVHHNWGAERKPAHGDVLEQAPEDTKKLVAHLTEVVKEVV